MTNRIFSGVYPCGIVYADREVEVSNDYKRLAFLNYSTLILDIEPDCPKELAEQIEEDVEKFVAKWKGKEFPTSTTGNTKVVIGDSA